MPDYRIERDRLLSFKNWPASVITPYALAKAGFYYTGEIDRVRCFFCSTEICRWEQSDDPMSEHRRWAGRCRFIRGLSSGNVRLGENPDTIPPYIGRDECEMDIRRNAVPDTPLHIHESRGQEPSTSAIPDEARMCVICYNNEKCMLFFPCLHVGVCVECSDKLEKNECITCKQEIRAKLKIFIV